jgi:L-ribulokinase
MKPASSSTLHYISISERTDGRANMSGGYLIGLDYGTDSARGVLIDTTRGEVCASHTHRYRHGTLIDALPDGTPLRAGWALQKASDYLECAEAILRALGQDTRIESIGIGLTASSPLPVSEDGTPLSTCFPKQPHAYVKLWKHQASQ